MGFITSIFMGAGKGIMKLANTFSSEKRADERQRFPRIEAACEIIYKSSVPFTNPTFQHRRLENGNDLEYARLSEFAKEMDAAQESIQRIASPELRTAMYELHQSCLGVLDEHWNDNVEQDDLTREIKDHRLAITQDVIARRVTFDKESKKQLRLK